MKFSLLKVLSSVACVLVFGNAFGQWPQEGNNDQNQRTELTLVEILNIRDQQCQNRVLVGLGNLLVNASNSGDEGAMFNLLSLIASLRHHWYVLNPWLDIQRRIGEIWQSPEKERYEYELLRLKLDGLQIVDDNPNSIDVSGAHPEFREFFLLQIIDKQQLLNKLTDWLIWADSQLNDANIRLFLYNMHDNMVRMGRVIIECLHIQSAEDGWYMIVQVRLQQKELEKHAVEINEFFKVNHIGLTISAYENFLYQQQENQSAEK